MKLVLLALLSSCYAPTFAACEVTCGSDSPCPESFTCGSDDHFCRAAGETTSCIAALTVTTNNQGDGHVSSQPQGIDCSTHDNRPCQMTFPTGTQVTLATQHNGQTSFNHWSGDACDGSQLPSCTFTLSGVMSINASFH